MSEKTITLGSFKYGLDGRRDVLSSVPGTLVRLVNAHINPGGEVEQRMSFVRLQNNLPANCYGLEATQDGLVTFGSANGPGGPLPVGVSYQQLTDPNLQGQMVSVVSSCNYKGKAFVIARFDNVVETLAFYDGKLVGAFRNGLVLNSPGGGGSETIIDLANDLAKQVNELDQWSAEANVDQNGLGSSGSVIVKTPPGIHMTPVITVNSANGAMGSQLIDQDATPTPGSAAHASFQIVSGTTGALAVSAPLHQDGTGVAMLCPSVPLSSTILQLAANIADQINQNTFLYGYTAVSDGVDTVTVYAPIEWGASPNAFSLTIDNSVGDIVVGAGNVTGSFQVSLSPANLEVLKVVKANVRSLTVSGTVSANYSGATGQVSFQWDETDEHGAVLTPSDPAASGIKMNATTFSSVGLSATVSTNTTKIGYFKCTVHDTGTNTTKVIKFYVLFEVDNNL